METGTLGAYQDKLRTFPNMRTKPYTPLIFRILLGINVRGFFSRDYLLFSAPVLIVL